MITYEVEPVAYSVEYLNEIMMTGIAQTECPEGCQVEPDGICPHGYESPLLEMGMI